MKLTDKIILGLLIVGIVVVVATQQRQINTLTDSVQEIKKDVKDIKAQIVYSERLQVRLSEQERECLTKNLFHEAGVEDYVGKVAVGHVTMNRLKTGKWGRDVCSVVHARKQFSWTLNRRIKYSKPKGQLWEESERAAKEVMKGARVNTISDDTLWYHTDYVSPKWAHPRKKVDKIGQHIFYNGTI